MPRVTLDLLRKRAEHNEGIIHSMEELALHQEELEKIELIGSLCRKLRILLLQNNIIEKIEGLSHMKDLRYLNLALNNIRKIEGLESCEYLEKLDLTVNFINFDTLEESLEHLKGKEHLRELFLIGNPCQADWDESFYFSFVIHTLPQLTYLDGKEITKARKIEALQNSNQVRADLSRRQQLMRQGERSDIAGQSQCINASQENTVNLQTQHPEAEEKTAHTPEVRREMYLELAEQKAEKELKEKERYPRERDYAKEHRERVGLERETEAQGEIRQCNEGKWGFKLEDEEMPGLLVLELATPKHLATSLIDVDLQPQHVSIVIKGKVFRLKFPEEIEVERSRCLRAKVTGALRIEMPKTRGAISVGTSRERTRNPFAKVLERAKLKGISCDMQKNAGARMPKMGDQILEASKVVNCRAVLSDISDAGRKLSKDRVADPAGYVADDKCNATGSWEFSNKLEFCNIADIPPLE